MNESFTELTVDTLNLKPEILRGVKGLGFEKLTPVQAAAIPLLLDGKDVIGQAQTGTGKTAAYGLPILEKADPENKEPQALILCPTRELAVQVANEIRSYASFMHGIRTLAVYGGQDISRQITALKGTQIVVGTPGRVMDHMRRHTLKLETVKTVILDEADEMLDMGFREDMETILGSIGQEHQTAMFSATMPPAIREIADAFLKEPVTVQITGEELTIPAIDQYYYSVKREYKVPALVRLITYYNYRKCMIFCNMKSTVDKLVSELQKEGVMAEALHGDLSQFLRDAAMKRFRENERCVLVATDIAARGIDVGDVEAVFNYDIPQEAEYYVHRIGRTGRAGKKGVSHTLVCSREFFKVRFIESVCHSEMLERTVPTPEEIRKARILQALEEAYHSISGGDASDAEGPEGSGAVEDENVKPEKRDSADKDRRPEKRGGSHRNNNTELLLRIHEYCLEKKIAPEELAAGFLRLKVGAEAEALDIDLPGKKDGRKKRVEGTALNASSLNDSPDRSRNARQGSVPGTRTATRKDDWNWQEEKKKPKWAEDTSSGKRSENGSFRKRKGDAAARRKNQDENCRWGDYSLIEQEFMEESRDVRKAAGRKPCQGASSEGGFSAGRDKSCPDKRDKKENSIRSRRILAEAVKDVNSRGRAVKTASSGQKHIAGNASAERKHAHDSASVGRKHIAGSVSSYQKHMKSDDARGWSAPKKKNRT